jgi:carboxylesterase
MQNLRYLGLGYLKGLLDRATYREDALTGLRVADRIVVEGKTPRVVAFHGYCGVPAEVALVCEAAREAGLAATAPLLAGHGVSAKALSSMRFEDWVESAEPELLAAAQQGPVILSGLSLGSLVALELTLKHPGLVSGLVLLSNALWLAGPFPALALRAVEKLHIPDFAMPKFTSDISDPEARATQTTFLAQPIHGAIALQNAGDRLQGELSRIQCPVLVLHGARDRVCPVQNAWRAAELIGSSDVEVRIFPRSHHILTRDVEHVQVREAITAFLRRLSA